MHTILLIEINNFMNGTGFPYALVIDLPPSCLAPACSGKGGSFHPAWPRVSCDTQEQ